MIRIVLTRRSVVSQDGVTAVFDMTVDGQTFELSVNEAQRLAADLVLAVADVEPARWGA